VSISSKGVEISDTGASAREFKCKLYEESLNYTVYPFEEFFSVSRFQTW
jgi:hypothetical protein